MEVLKDMDEDRLEELGDGKYIFHFAPINLVPGRTMKSSQGRFHCDKCNLITDGVPTAEHERTCPVCGKVFAK